MCFFNIDSKYYFLYVYLGVCTKVSLATNISTSIFNNNIIDYKDNEITIEYSNLNNYYNEKETKIKIYFNKDRYSNLNVLNLYNKINKETITRNKIELILNEFFLIVLLLIK